MVTIHKAAEFYFHHVVDCVTIATSLLHNFSLFCVEDEVFEVFLFSFVCLFVDLKWRQIPVVLCSITLNSTSAHQSVTSTVTWTTSCQKVVCQVS